MNLLLISLIALFATNTIAHEMQYCAHDDICVNYKCCIGYVCKDCNLGRYKKNNILNLNDFFKQREISNEEENNSLPTPSPIKNKNKNNDKCIFIYSKKIWISLCLNNIVQNKNLKFEI